jgi:hypothetical protein
MKTLLATALLLGLSSFTAAHAEWEILDPGTAVNAQAKSNASTMDASSDCTPPLLSQKAIENGSHHQPTSAEIACKQRSASGSATPRP